MNTEPQDLDDVVNILIEEIQKQNAVEEVAQAGFSHHGTGTSIRNTLKLWWQEDCSEPKPALVQWFNDRNIFMADDMSGTINAAVKAKLNNKHFDFDKHVKVYFAHWKKYGFKDGIFKYNK